jgi:hypothetical protein
VETNGLQTIPVNQEEFIGPEEVQRRATAELKERYEQWRANSAASGADPSMLVYFNFEQDAATKIVNQAKSKTAGDGKLAGAKWAEGRWPGKRALRFRNWSDSVRFNVPGKYGSLTFLAWVYVDGLPHPYNSVADAAWKSEGHPNWQITKKGELSFSIRGTNGNTSANVRHLIFSRKNFHRWMQIAAVYDGENRSLSLYADGRLIANKAVNDPQPLVLGTVDLGNWPTKDDHRNFVGRIDEFAVLSRALSAVEIQHSYDSGRPRSQTSAK